MEAQQMKQRIERLEQCADDAKAALGSAPSQDLRKDVEELHQMASQAKKQCEQGADQQQLQGAVVRLESCADRAMEDCRKAGNVDEKLKSAIQRAHSEASQLKREMMQAA